MQRLMHPMALGLFLAGVMAGSVPASPGDRTGHGARIDFEQIDADGDGHITRDEMQAHRTAMLAAADADGDGKLSLAEVQARVGESARAERMMRRFDADGDGLLSSDELPGEARALQRFERIDADGDGVVSRAEFDAMKDRSGKRRAVAD